MTRASTASKVLLVAAHPCADSFTMAVAAAARHGLERGGHDVTVVDLYADGFRPGLDLADLTAYRASEPPPDAQAREHGELVRAADTLVFVYPTWWSGLPAMLQGWLERVLVPGVAFSFDDRGKVTPGMQQIRRIIGISTYGSPWTYAKLMHDNGRRTLTRALRMNCGRGTATSWLGLYSIDTTGDSERKAFLDRVEHEMSRVR